MKTRSKNYYKILGIPGNADATTIKKSFRKLAMELHPDRNPDDPECEDKFKDVTEAYGVLIDPVKRKEYDRHRAGLFTETTSDDYDFKYSQKDIFENMFRQGFAKDIFEELNNEFSRQGFRSGKNFFAAVLFGGAAGKLGRLLAFIPGPIGRIGMGLRLLQTVGASLYAFNKMRQGRVNNPTTAPKDKPDAKLKEPPFGFFKKADKPDEDNLDIRFAITIAKADAIAGTQKRLSYSIGDEKEILLVTIPPETNSGQKLRIKDKGRKKDNLRGDLILTVNHGPA